MKVLINTLIIIIIAHIVLNNLEVDDKIENYETDNNRLRFLLDDEQDDKTESLLDFMKEQDHVKPSNYFEEEDEAGDMSTNTPNFDTNVVDMNKYFQRNYDSITKDNKPVKQEPEIETVDTMSNNVCFLNDQDNGCTISNVQWKYKDEQVQNGGQFVNGVTAFDNLGDEYAVYNVGSLNLTSKINDVSMPTNSNNLN